MNIEKTREFQKNICLSFLNYAKAFDCVDQDKLWKALRVVGIADYTACLLRILCVGQKATVITLYVKADWSGLRKEYDRAVCCHPVCLIYMLSTS